MSCAFVQEVSERNGATQLAKQLAWLPLLRSLCLNSSGDFDGDLFGVWRPLKRRA